MNIEELKARAEELGRQVRHLLDYSSLTQRNISANQSLVADRAEKQDARIEELEKITGQQMGIKISMSAQKNNPSGQDFNHFEFSAPPELTEFKTYGRLTNRTDWIDAKTGAQSVSGIPTSGGPLVHPHNVLISINGGQPVSDWLDDWVLAFNLMNERKDVPFVAAKHSSSSVIVYSTDLSITLEAPVFSIRSGAFSTIVSAESVERSVDPEVQRVRTDVDDIKQEILDFGPAYTKLANSVESIDTALSSLTTKIEEFDAALKAAGTELTDARARVSSVEASLITLATSVTDNRSLLTGHDNEFALLKARVAALE